VNRRYKNLAELAVVYHKMSKSLVTEYEDGRIYLFIAILLVDDTNALHLLT